MKKWSVVGILACAQFIMVLDSTVMNVSISEVVADLDTTVSGLQAAITFYTLTMAAFMLTGGKLGDIWGRLKAFRIGSIVYALGSLITAFSPNLAVLLIGWSVIEGLGAVLVIPAIAALVATNYSGKDRVVGYTILGAASGIAVAAGPLIGGYVTTYLSWRYVFASETVIMAIILIVSSVTGIIRETGAALEENRKRDLDRVVQEGNREQAREGDAAYNDSVPSIDIPSVILSASGLALLIFGILQSKTWGWVIPKEIPQIGGLNIDPFGISLVTYLIIAGGIVLKLFINRQQDLEQANANPLLTVSMFSIKPLRAGLGVLSAQYLIIAAVFFALPIYLQMVLGYDALETGKKIFPLSVAIVAFSAIGSRLVNRYTPRQIIRMGQLALVGGALLLLAAMSPELEGLLFATGLLVLGAGLGLLASQIGNVTMSSVSQAKTSEVGGLQGTFQNLGSSLGTALIGSVMIASLTTGFVNGISNNPAVPEDTRATIAQRSNETVLPIVSAPQVEQYAIAQGLTQEQAEAIGDTYRESQIGSLRASMFFIAVLGLLTIRLSRYIPNKKMV